jgi:hypothetical protein
LGARNASSRLSTTILITTAMPGSSKRSGLTALMIASEIVSLWMVGGDRPIFITSPANKRFGKASTVNEALSPSLTLPMSILAEINFDLHGGKIRSDEEERRHP